MTAVVAWLSAAARAGVVGVALVGVLALALTPRPVSALVQRVAVLYVAPVAGPVVDPFRPPSHIGAPGNRGLEYLSPADVIVRAAADGSVSFAGPVAGRQVITIAHADGLRTTYTGLAEVWVSAGDQVAQNASLGLTAGNLHFGALVGAGHYLDPQVLIDASQPVERVFLVPPPQ